MAGETACGKAHWHVEGVTGNCPMLRASWWLTGTRGCETGCFWALRWRPPCPGQWRLSGRPDRACSLVQPLRPRGPHRDSGPTTSMTNWMSPSEQEPGLQTLGTSWEWPGALPKATASLLFTLPRHLRPPFLPGPPAEGWRDRPQGPQGQVVPREALMQTDQDALLLT